MPVTDIAAGMGLVGTSTGGAGWSPSAAGLTVMGRARADVWPLPGTFTVQVTSVLVETTQPVAVGELNVVPVGALTVKTAPVAFEVPLLLTVTWRFEVPPGSTVPSAGAVAVAESVVLRLPVPASVPEVV